MLKKLISYPWEYFIAVLILIGFIVFMFSSLLFTSNKTKYRRCLQYKQYSVFPEANRKGCKDMYNYSK